MNLSARTEYACVAMLELSANFGSGEPIQIRRIADAHGIPSRFLVQILLQLKGAGLVNSTRGASGGYRLSKDPAEITLGVVMSVIDGQVEEVVSGMTRETPASVALFETWNAVAAVQRDMLESVTLADLLERAAGRAENMYYI
jgi:Rrf2 family protein